MAYTIEAVGQPIEVRVDQAEYLDIASGVTLDPPSPRARTSSFTGGIFQGYGEYRWGHAGSALSVASPDSSKVDELKEPSAATLAQHVRERFQSAHEAGEIHGSGGAVGTTALKHGNTLILANVGDVQAYFLPKKGQMRRLTQPHNTSNKAERARIEAAGGLVEEIDGQQLFFGRWPFSRAVGDHEAPAPMIPDCEVSTMKLTAPGMLVMATRGVWQAFREGEVGSLLSEAEHDRALKAAAQTLADESAAKVQQNIGVLIARFEACEQPKATPLSWKRTEN